MLFKMSQIDKIKFNLIKHKVESKASYATNTFFFLLGIKTL